MLLQNLSTEPDCWKALPSWGPAPSAPPGFTWQGLMRRALRLARAAARVGEIPVGALVVGPEGEILSEAHNETEALHDPTAHAEVLALRRAAAKVGTLMRRIAAQRQVLCVTHLAQIAACGHTHLMVSKSVADGRTYTAVEDLAEDRRLQELARIMGGTVTDATLSAAQELRIRAKEDTV